MHSATDTTTITYFGNIKVVVIGAAGNGSTCSTGSNDLFVPAELVIYELYEPTHRDWNELKQFGEAITHLRLYRQLERVEQALLEAYHNYLFGLDIRRMFNTCKAVLIRRSLRCDRKGIGLRIKSDK